MRPEPEIRAALSDLELALDRFNGTYDESLIGFSVKYTLAWILMQEDEKCSPFVNLIDNIRKQSVLEDLHK